MGQDKQASFFSSAGVWNIDSNRNLSLHRLSSLPDLACQSTYANQPQQPVTVLEIMKKDMKAKDVTAKHVSPTTYHFLY